MTASPALLFRRGLLDGQVVVAGGASDSYGAEVARACADLDATVAGLGVADALDEEAVTASVQQLHERHGRIDTLVDDAAARFAVAAADQGVNAMRAAADGAWIAARAVATTAMIDADGGGKIVLLAPPENAGPYAHACRAALENLARTLSVEWARYDIRTTAVTPGERSGADEVAALAAYLASPAGDYYSGCRLDLT